MDGNELKAYNQRQAAAIHEYKWLESERRGYDIGERQAALEWIGKYGRAFREENAAEPATTRVST